jgi:hypothetical protein
MIGTSLNEIKKLKIKGESILKKELEYSINVPPTKRLIMLNHHINPEGEGEPYDRDEVIKEAYLSTYGY